MKAATFLAAVLVAGEAVHLVLAPVDGGEAGLVGWRVEALWLCDNGDVVLVSAGDIRASCAEAHADRDAVERDACHKLGAAS